MKGKIQYGSSSSSNNASRRAVLEAVFRQKLHHFGLELHETEPDGNCLFRAVAHQMYGDQSFHNLVREACMNYMEKERDFFLQFINGEDFEQYIRRKRQDKVHGNHVEIQAMSELYARPFEVYAVEEFARSEDPKPRFISQEGFEGTPVRLSYHDGNHYNSILNPSDPRIGEGLLPGFKTREEIESDLIQRVTEMTERDALQQDLESMVIEKSAREDEEVLLRRIKESSLAEEEDRMYREFQRRQFGQAYPPPREQTRRRPSEDDSAESDILDHVLRMTAADEERKMLELAKWQSLRDQ